LELFFMAVPSFGVLNTPKPPSDKPPSPDTPFRIAVLGDFSGRASRGERRDAKALGAIKGIAIERDTLDEVMARLKATAKVHLGDDETADLRFQSLDDFHPDEVFEKIDKFEDLDDDDEKASLMRAVLRDPGYASLEAAWRGIDWLLKRVHKTGSGIQVTLFDLTRDELFADLGATHELAETGLYKMLLAPIFDTGKGLPWALLLGVYTFEMSPEAIVVLGKLAKFAAAGAAPWLSAAEPAVLESSFELGSETAAAWQSLRRLPETALVGLAAPRFLSRQPFGENTKSIDKFPFEEVDPRQGREGYSWCNPAFAAACLLGLAFHKESWGFKTGAVLDLGELPMHVWRDEDGDEQVTLAEAWLERKTTERLVKLGLMPLLSVRGKNALQLLRFVSLAEPPKGQPAVDLIGRWGQKGALKVPRSIGLGGGGGVSLVGGPAPAPARAQAEKPAQAVAPEEAAASDETPTEDAPAEQAPAEAPAEDPELAALMEQLDEPPATASAPPAEAEVDPELAALMKQLESGGETPAAPPALEEEPMDPELAALMKQLEGGDQPAESPPVESAPAAHPAPEEEPMDPELAALMKQLEGGDQPTESPPDESAAAAPPSPEEEPMDPELAALMQQLEEGDQSPEAPPAEPAAPAPAAEEPMDPELAALMQQLEASEQPTEAAPAAVAAPAGEPMDPELEALMKQLEGGDQVAPEAGAESKQAVVAVPRQAPGPPPALQAEIDRLGGRKVLDDLGWPVFAPAFMSDGERLVRILKKKLKNKAVEKEVADLVKKSGGYGSLANDDIRPDMGLNTQLAKLRNVRQALEFDALLKNDDLIAMADAYGANLKKVALLKAKSDLLGQVREYDQWARERGNAEMAAALDGCPFKERRQAQLAQQLKAQGGDAAFNAAVAAHPAGIDAKATPEAKIALLKTLKAYDKLGGDALFVEKVGNPSRETPLQTKLEQLKAVLAAAE
jgi:hypothetical protein